MGVQGVYFETAIVFLENEELFSANSSGARYPAQANQAAEKMRIEQDFAFPRLPQPGSRYSLQAEVSVLNLPVGYQPPEGVDLVGPGFITVPVRFELPVGVQTCP